MAPDAASAETLASGLPRAEQAFAAYFGRDVQPYVVAVGAENRARRSELEDRGLIVFPWLLPEERTSAIQSSVRAAVEPQLRALGLPDEQIEQQIAATLAQRPAVNQDTDAATVAHELGHSWLRVAFGDERPAEGEERYASSLPDWLDETAAVLMETDEMTHSRRAHFANLARDHPERVTPLEQYFTRDHPVHRQARALARSGGAREGGATVRVVTQEEAERAGMDLSGGAAFYSQSRVFADFLVERAGDERVFSAIAESLARGETMDAWLSQWGRRWNLPSTVLELDRDWREWAAGRPAP